MNKSDLHYFLLLSEKIDDIPSLGVAFSLVFMVESLIIFHRAEEDFSVHCTEIIGYHQSTSYEIRSACKTSKE